jgi:hypothetical protein
MVVTWTMLFASATLSFAQSAGKPGTWEKSQQCADQAEKAMAAHVAPRDQLVTWNNHYSPKYDKCFIEIRHMVRIVGPNPTHTNVIYTGEVRWLGSELQDAFERSELAWFTPIEKQVCRVEGETVDCVRARNFIAEHMKN